MAESTLPTIVIGGGIGGLTTALALLQRGLDVVVYEQAPVLREVGAGVQIGSNGTRVLFALGLEEALRAVQVVPPRRQLRHWRTGETWDWIALGQASVQRFGTPHILMHRNDLHGILVEAIRKRKPDAIKLGMRCEAVTQTADAATAQFANGERADGHAIIAPTAFTRRSVPACSAPASHNSPAASPGAGWSRWIGCRRIWRSFSPRTGSARTATCCIIRCVAAN